MYPSIVANGCFFVCVNEYLLLFVPCACDQLFNNLLQSTCISTAQDQSSPCTVEHACTFYNGKITIEQTQYQSAG